MTENTGDYELIIEEIFLEDGIAHKVDFQEGKWIAKTPNGKVAALKNGLLLYFECNESGQTWVRHETGWKLTHHPPKSQKGVRNIPLPAEAIEVLKQLKTLQANEAEKMGKLYLGNGVKHDLKQDQWFVFTWEDGRLVDPFYLSSHFAKLIKNYGLSLNFHGLRHSYATALLEVGEHPKVVQELLGDSTISVVLDTYSHVLPGLKERAASKLDNLFGTKKISSVKEG